MSSEEKKEHISSRKISAQDLTGWADILRDRSALGLYYTSNIYDREHYQKIQDVAIEMVAAATVLPTSEIEPLRTTFFARPSPIPSCDAAVIDDTGRILLIRRADNASWAMPGGGIAVGETPVQAAVREVLEETGIRCEPVAFVGLHDSRLCGSADPFHLYHLLFLCRPLFDDEKKGPPTHVHEVLEMDWFAEHAIPAHLHAGHTPRLKEAFRVWHGDLRAYFDH
jgi:8-oxo-dGTP pyrophosphatase MutT (NUDIX family)